MHVRRLAFLNKLFRDVGHFPCQSAHRKSISQAHGMNSIFLQWITCTTFPSITCYTCTTFFAIFLVNKLKVCRFYLSLYRTTTSLAHAYPDKLVQFSTTCILVSIKMQHSRLNKKKRLQYYQNYLSMIEMRRKRGNASFLSTCICIFYYFMLCFHLIENVAK